MNRLIITIISALLIAAVVHISAILLLPRVAPEDIYTRLAAYGEGNGFHLLDAPKTGGVGDPNNDPAIVMAICRYDLSNTPFRVLGDPSIWYWSLALHNNRGFIYYSVNNRAIGDRPLDLRILDQEDYAAKQQEEVEEAAQEFIVASPSTRGYVVLRALVPEPSARTQIEQSLKGVGCSSYKPADK